MGVSQRDLVVVEVVEEANGDFPDAGGVCFDDIAGAAAGTVNRGLFPLQKLC